MAGFDFNAVPEWAQIDADSLVRSVSGAAVILGLVAGKETAADYIHRWISHSLWHEAGWLGRVRVSGGLALLPGAALLLAIPLTVKNGAMVRRVTGKSRTRQLTEQLRLAFGHSILPPWYFVFELFEDSKFERAAEYLNRFETKGLLYPFLRDWAVRQSGIPGTGKALSNKVLFSERCQEFGLAVVPVLMVVRKGAVGDGFSAVLPPRNLFLKPKRGTGGCGAERWDYRPDGSFQDAAGQILTGSQLLRRVETLSTDVDYLVQPRLVNHPDIADLSTGALITARIVTCRDEHGGYEVTNAMFRMAQGEASVVDNFHAGGLAAKVDLATGELGPATDGGLSLKTGWLDSHPVTGAPIRGRRLPVWQETLELAVRAHAAFPDNVAIGWDIALLADGPCLVEGNKGPDLDIVQRTHREPVGNARLGQLLALHLRTARAEKHR